MKLVCGDCKWTGDSIEVLRGKNPFEGSEVTACPSCKILEGHLFAGCHAKDCKKRAICGRTQNGVYGLWCEEHKNVCNLCDDEGCEVCILGSPRQNEPHGGAASTGPAKVGGNGESPAAAPPDSSETRDIIAEFVPGGMAPDTYHLRLPWGAVLVIAAEDREDAGLSFYATEDAYNSGKPDGSLAFHVIC